MSTKEILTIQFGHYANYVGTHWWNLQDLSFQYNSSAPSEIDHDVLYREGRTQKNEVTYTPRLLLVDLKGSLGTLPEEGDLYHPTSNHNAVTWQENKIKIQQLESSHSKHPFQLDLEDPTKAQHVFNTNYNFSKTVHVWSDFLYSRFHPRTIEMIKEYQHCNENTPFDSFTLGYSLWKTRQFSEDFSDKIRNYIEECDHFQGFHIITDCSNAFSGLSSHCLEFISDEYDRKSVLVAPVIPSYFSDNTYNSESEKVHSLINDSVRVINMALSFQAYSSNSSLFVPMSLGSKGWRQPGPKRIIKNLEYDNKLPYHSSAILAAALDTITLKHRLKLSSFTLSDLAADLTHFDRKAVAASINMPFPIEENSDLLDFLDNNKEPLYQSITPNCNIGTRRLMQHITIRGIPEDKLKKPINKAQKQRELPAYRSNSIKEMMDLYLAYSTEATASNVTVVQAALNVKTPFPQIFGDNVGRNGFICNGPRTSDSKVERVPVLTGLHNGSEVGKMLDSLLVEAKKLNIKRFHQFSTSDFSKEDYDERLDDLLTLRENYEDNHLL